MYKMCNKCGYFYDDADDSKCPQCGSENETATVLGEMPEEINSDKLTHCKNCGSAITDEDDFCPNCLFPIDGNEVDDAVIDKFKDSLQNREPNENEHKCKNCGNIQSKEIRRCLKCSEIINSEENDKTDDIVINEVLENDTESENINDLGNQNQINNIPGNEMNNDIISTNGTDSDIQYSNTDSENASNLSNFKKTTAIVVGIILVLVVVVIIVLVAKSNEPIRINLSDYVSSSIYTDADFEAYNNEHSNEYEDYGYEEYSEESELRSFYSNYDIGAGLPVYGYNEYATVDTYSLKNVIDWDALQNDIDEQLRHKKKYEKRYMTFFDFIDMNSFEFTADKTESICNGDSINVTINTNLSYTFNDVTIEISDLYYIYNIENLKTVQAFDPFDYVTFVQYNANGYASAGCRVKEDLNENIDGLEGFKVTYYNEETIAIEKDDYIIAKIDFYFNDDTESYHNYKNGETVTMYCSCSNYDLADEYNIYIGIYQKDYTFSDLGEYITKSTKISQDELNKFTSHASSIIGDNYGDYGYYSNFKFDSAYIADLKDKTESHSFHNNLCLIYSYSHEDSWSEEIETEYLYVIYENLIISDSGEIEFLPEDYYETINKGYDSVDEILSYKFDSDYNTAKV